MGAKHMLERGQATPSGCVPFFRLFELLGITEQYDVVGGLASPASTLASDIWPASSTKSTSTDLANSGLLQSQAVRQAP